MKNTTLQTANRYADKFNNAVITGVSAVALGQEFDIATTGTRLACGAYTTWEAYLESMAKNIGNVARNIGESYEMNEDHIMLGLEILANAWDRQMAAASTMVNFIFAISQMIQDDELPTEETIIEAVADTVSNVATTAYTNVVFKAREALELKEPPLQASTEDITLEELDAWEQKYEAILGQPQADAPTWELQRFAMAFVTVAIA